MRVGDARIGKDLRIAIDVSSGHAVGEQRVPGLAKPRQRAFSGPQDRDLEEALVRLDKTREELAEVEADLVARMQERDRIDEAMLKALPIALAYDRRETRVRALAAERDKVLEVLRAVYARLSPYRSMLGKEQNVMWVGMGGSLQDMEQSKLPGFKEPENP